MTDLITDGSVIGQRRDASKPPPRRRTGPSRGVAALARAHAKQYVAPSTATEPAPRVLERITRLRKTERNRRKKLNNRRNQRASNRTLS
jgi:hypothetical protein